VIVTQRLACSRLASIFARWRPVPWRSPLVNGTAPTARLQSMAEKA